MKKLKCKDIGGGTCDYEMTASTSEEMLEKYNEHIKTTLDEGHIRIFNKMKSMTTEEAIDWRSIFIEKWNTTPESNSI